MLTLSVDIALSRVSGTGRMCISALPSLLRGIGLPAAVSPSINQSINNPSISQSVSQSVSLSAYPPINQMVLLMVIAAEASHCNSAHVTHLYAFG